MKKFIGIIIGVVLVVCGFYNIYYHQLFTNTDKLVNSLYGEYKSYGLLGGVDEMEVTDIGKFQTTPIGRLVNVRINKEDCSDTEYEILRKVLTFHYWGNNKVRNVYICGLGTLMIDCRN